MDWSRIVPGAPFRALWRSVKSFVSRSRYGGSIGASKFILNHMGCLGRMGEVLGYFGEDALRLTAGATLLVWMLVTTVLFSQHLYELQPVLMLAIIVVTLFLSQSLASEHFAEAALFYLGSQLALISLLVHTTTNFSLCHLFILAVTMAGAFLGPLGAFLEALAAVVCQLVLYWLLPSKEANAQILTATLLSTGVASLVTWLSSLTLLSALSAAEAMSMESRRHLLELRDSQGELNRTVKMLRLAEERLRRANIELSRSRNAAEEAQRFKTQLASRISHELRTPLNLIIGFSETMAFSPQSYGEPLPAPYHRDIAEIYRASRHLMGLITDILDLAKLQAGRLALTRESLHIVDILDEAVHIVQGLAERKGLWLRKEVMPGIAPIMADKTRIRQVLLNLLSNAVRLTTTGGVTLKARQVRDEVIVEVQDTGPGIPRDQLVHVFEEFSQIEDPRIKYQQGIGLGLSISKEIVELHGGRIWVQSQVGEGSTFGFSLPCEGAPPYSQLITLERAPAKPNELPAVVVMPWQGHSLIFFLRRHLEHFVVLEGDDWAKLPEVIKREGARAVISSPNAIPTRIPEGIEVPIIVCPLGRASAPAILQEVNEFLEKPVTVETIRKCLARYGAKNMTIVLIAENHLSARMLTRMISACSNGHVLLCARNREQLVEGLESGRPDLVLLDHDLSTNEQITGFIESIRARYSKDELPIVMLAWDYDDDNVESQEVRLIAPKGLTVTASLRYLDALLEAINEVGTSPTFPA